MTETETQEEVVNLVIESLNWLMTGALSYQNTMNEESKQAKEQVKKLKVIERMVRPLDNVNSDQESKDKATNVYNTMRQIRGEEYADKTNKEVFTEFKKQVKETC